MISKLECTKVEQEPRPRMAWQNENTLYDQSMKTLMDSHEAAVFLKTTRSTIWSLVQKRAIPHMRASRKLYFFKEDLLAFLESKAINPSQGPAADGRRR